MNRKKYGFVFCLLVVIAMISLGTVSIYVNHEEKKEATEQLRVAHYFELFFTRRVGRFRVGNVAESVGVDPAGYRNWDKTANRSIEPFSDVKQVAN